MDIEKLITPKPNSVQEFTNMLFNSLRKYELNGEKIERAGYSFSCSYNDEKYRTALLSAIRQGVTEIYEYFSLGVNQEDEPGETSKTIVGYVDIVTEEVKQILNGTSKYSKYLGTIEGNVDKEDREYSVILDLVKLIKPTVEGYEITLTYELFLCKKNKDTGKLEIVID